MDKDKGTLKIIDFGLARPETNRLATDAIVGTYPYMSPEIFESGGRVDSYGPACDMWALGIIMN